MATFYVLSSRHLLGQRFVDLLTATFPRTAFTPWDWPELAEALAAMIEERSEAFVIFREDLDDRLGVKESVRRDFGAEEHDEILEIELDAVPYRILPQPWGVGPARKAA